MLQLTNSQAPETSAINPIRLLIVEAHDQVRGALALRLLHMPEATVLAAVGDISSAVPLVGRLKPDLVLCEPKTGSAHQPIRLDALIKTGQPIVVWTSSLSDQEAESYLRAGATAVLLKDPNITQLVATLTSIAVQAPRA